jgi:hypothetical protein
MHLTVAEFTPKTKKFMTVPLVTPQNGAYVFVDQYPAPVALKELQLDILGRTCKRHAESMSTKLHDFAPSKTDEIDGMPYRLLQTISRYHTQISPTSNVCILSLATYFT